jgi:DNA-directed RNA polymerase subunit M/transcription elongation factor TFIIS
MVQSERLNQQKTGGGIDKAMQDYQKQASPEKGNFMTALKAGIIAVAVIITFGAYTANAEHPTVVRTSPHTGYITDKATGKTIGGMLHGNVFYPEKGEPFMTHTTINNDRWKQDTTTKHYQNQLSIEEQLKQNRKNAAEAEKTCPKCGAVYHDRNMKFCTKDGRQLKEKLIVDKSLTASLVKRCPKCGAAYHDNNMKFCTKDGKKLVSK